MRRVGIVIVLVSVALAGVIGWQIAQPGEPVYQGRTLTSWLRDLQPIPSGKKIDIRQIGTNPEAQEAVRQIGTKAIPTLLRLLRARDSAFKVMVINLVQRQHVIKVGYTRAADQNLLGLYGFEVLRTNAQSAVPALIQIADENVSFHSRWYAVSCLGYIGLPAQRAVPCLLQCATNADAILRSDARSALLRIDPEAAAQAGITNGL